MLCALCIHAYSLHALAMSKQSLNQRGCCIMSLWLQNFCPSSYSMRTLHSWSKKIPGLGIRVIKAYTDFQQYPCIIFEDMSILLSAIFIFCGPILLLVTEISEQPRYIFANISGLGEYFSKWNFALKHWVHAGTMNHIFGIIIIITRHLCCSEVSASSNKVRP